MKQLFCLLLALCLVLLCGCGAKTEAAEAPSSVLNPSNTEKRTEAPAAENVQPAPESPARPAPEAEQPPAAPTPQADAPVWPGSPAQPDEDGQDAAPAPTPKPSAAPTPAQSSARITEMYSYDEYYTDSVGNTWLCSWHVPQINAATADAADVNNDIEKNVACYISDEKYAMSQGTSIFVHTISWQEFWYGDVVCLLTKVEFDYDYHEYAVFCYDFAAGERLYTPDIIALAGLTEDEFFFRAQTAAAATYETYAGGVRDTLPEEYERGLEWTISPERINSDTPVYIDGRGNLFMVADIYTFAGAGSYQFIIQVY